tara:strand:- start:301 stop:777 length:477 start_codon:yes stop_codon:yes gene_type:complete
MKSKNLIIILLILISVGMLMDMVDTMDGDVFEFLNQEKELDGKYISCNPLRETESLYELNVIGYEFSKGKVFVSDVYITDTNANISRRELSEYDTTPTQVWWDPGYTLDRKTLVLYHHSSDSEFQCKSVKKTMHDGLLMEDLNKTMKEIKRRMKGNKI